MHRGFESARFSRIWILAVCGNKKPLISKTSKAILKWTKFSNEFSNEKYIIVCWADFVKGLTIYKNPNKPK